MAGIRFADIVDNVETITNVQNQNAFVKRKVNDAVARIGAAWDWPFLWDNTFFTTAAVEETGTVTVTNGSATVTGAGTAFTAAMVGRKFRVESESAYYRIKAVASVISLTLETVYQGDDSAGSSFKIFKDEFRLRADVDQHKLIRQIENGIPLFSLTPRMLDMHIPAPDASGPADWEVFIGRDVATYSTGTVSITSGSRTLNGASTDWTTADGLTRGTKLQIGTVVFTVKSVDTATQITVYEVATATIAALTTYSAVIDNVLVQLYTIPDTVENYYYRFQRIPAVLDADAAIPDLPHQLQELIELAAQVPLWRHKGMADRAAEAEAEYGRRFNEAVRKYGHSSPDRVQQRQSSSRHRVFIGPRFPSNFGIGRQF